MAGNAPLHFCVADDAEAVKIRLIATTMQGATWTMSERIGPIGVRASVQNRILMLVD